MPRSYSSEARVWALLCERCEELFEKYGHGIIIPPCIVTCDPLSAYDETDVKCNVWRFVVYIMWLKQHPHAVDEYIRVKTERPQSWLTALVKLATL